MAEQDEEFWAVQEDWSRRKHQILVHYLTPAAAKLRRVSADGRVLVVDGFAGRGTYADGEPGSPVHICRLADTTASWQQPLKLEVFNIEPDSSNFEALRAATAAWEKRGIVRNVHGTFQDRVATVMAAAASSSVIVFLDPFRPKQLLFEDFSPLLQRQAPTDVMIVFMTPAIVRVIRAASPDSGTSEPVKERHRAFLDGVFGGQEWRPLLDHSPLDPDAVVECFHQSLLKRAGPGRTAYVCSTSIRQRYQGGLKYDIVLFTRHRDGALLINDAFCKTLSQ